MRFDDDGYLKAFKESGAYPAIHDDIFNLINNCCTGRKALDLCCSTGLLGHRLAFNAANPLPAMGVDADKDAIQRGIAAGVKIYMQCLRLQNYNLSFFGQVLAGDGTEVLIARRCLPELLGWRTSQAPTDAQREMLAAFPRVLRDAGVKEIFLEGRRYSVGSVSTLPNVAAEVAAMAPYYNEVKRHKECSYLRVRG